MKNTGMYKVGRKRWGPQATVNTVSLDEIALKRVTRCDESDYKAVGTGGLQHGMPRGQAALLPSLPTAVGWGVLYL